MRNIETAIILLKSTGKYVAKRIDSSIDREAYLEGIDTCVDAFEGAKEHGYERLKYLMKIGNDFVHTKKFRRRGLFTNPKAYYRMAFKHATDIVNSITERFI